MLQVLLHRLFHTHTPHHPVCISKKRTPPLIRASASPLAHGALESVNLWPKSSARTGMRWSPRPSKNLSTSHYAFSCSWLWQLLVDSFVPGMTAFGGAERTLPQRIQLGQLPVAIAPSSSTVRPNSLDGESHDTRRILAYGIPELHL